MTNKFYTIAKYGAAALGIIGIILLVRVIMGGEAVETDAELQTSVVDPFVSFTIVMLVVTTVLAVGFSLLGLLKNGAALKKALLSVGLLAVFFIIAYSVSSDGEVTNKFGQVIEFGEKGSISKNAGALIIFSYFLGAIGLASVLWGSVKDMFAKN
ncbi:MAG: hypothetical protein BM563_03805 [Bacteroidetes bacterium MedPE-SWsnd-G1]|nr:MAG: hypothetical protein BM563_03805 [Bacteroidetes bacterium MedPE-SWsnd-G1]